MSTFPYAAKKECRDCNYYSARMGGEADVTAKLKLGALRSQSRREAGVSITEYLKSPQQGAWETATRARISGLLNACSECDYKNPLIANGLMQIELQEK